MKICAAADRKLHRRLDVRIIPRNDEAALVQLWRNKRGEVGPENLSGTLVVQLERQLSSIGANRFFIVSAVVSAAHQPYRHSIREKQRLRARAPSKSFAPFFGQHRSQGPPLDRLTLGKGPARFARSD
jgi:hypothetical protein